MNARAIVIFVCLLSLASARAVDALDTNRVREIAAWLPAKPAGLGRPAGDRAAWKRLAPRSVSRPLLASARELAASPVPPASEEQFLDFSRTGNRERYQSILTARGRRLATLALAECVEDRGRFVAPLADSLQALATERTWVYPAHDRRLDNFYGRTMEMDLRATAVAWELGTIDSLLGDKLPQATRKLIRQEVRRRVLQPFREMVEGTRKPVYWLKTDNNWNAVCLAGVTGAALALEEAPQDRAFYVAAAEHYIRYFLRGFTPDGYCSEGLGYWNYGFGHFFMLGETVRQATGGHVDLVADPAALAPARFGLRTEIINGIYPSIADSSPGGRPSQSLVRLIQQRLGLMAEASPKREALRGSSSAVATVFYAFLEEPLPAIPHPANAAESPLRSWFPDGGLLICRAAGGKPFGAALKGGHNAESHNHNDVGSFSVIAGRTMLICDPGSEVYTARTFGSHRYKSKVLNSFGHAVPVVAGRLQRPGRDARAKIVRADFSDRQDTLVLDIRSAYPVAELTKLERSFVFNHDECRLTVEDTVQLGEPKAFESALITWADWKRASDHELILSDGADALRVRIDTGGLPFDVKAETLDEDVHTSKKPVRLGITLRAPVREARVTFTITPAAPFSKRAP